MNLNLDNIILNICRNEYDYFLYKNNVVGIGFGYKQINNKKTKEKALQVFVSRKLPLHHLSSNDIIPSSYKGIKTDVIETGEFSTTSLTHRIRPVLGGYSIGPAGLEFAGSYGALVTDGISLYILSNNHVLAGDNIVPIGNPILQPAATDKGVSPKDRIAYLSKFVPVQFCSGETCPENYVDCAIAKIINANLVSSFITFIGVPTGIVLPQLTFSVQMACRSSEYLIGGIKSYGSTLKVKFKGTPEKIALFKNQIVLDFAASSGDSGSLVLTNDKKALGLEFASADKTSLCNPIISVLDSLNVTLVTK